MQTPQTERSHLFAIEYFHSYELEQAIRTGFKAIDQHTFSTAFDMLPSQ